MYKKGLPKKKELKSDKTCLKNNATKESDRKTTRLIKRDKKYMISVKYFQKRISPLVLDIIGLIKSPRNDM